MKPQRRKLLISAALSCASASLFLASQTALANTADAKETANYPNKPIHFIVPYPAGGGTDTMARALGSHLSQKFGVPVVVENKPGASGNIGNDIVAKAKPDGYTILIGITALIQTPALYKNVPYEISDFAPISQLALSSDFFIVHKDVPANTIDEFIELAKKDPQKYSYGNYGNGTSSNMHGELLKLNTGAQITAVPYQGSAPLVNAILGGQVSSAFLDATSANPHLESDRIKILGLTGKTRHPSLPDVATFSEQGYDGFEANGWFATFAPANTPQPIIEKLSTEIQHYVASEEFGKRLSSMGLRPVGGTPEELAEVLKNDAPNWASIVERANITVN